MWHLAGDGTTTQRNASVAVLELTSGAVDVSVGFQHSCALQTGRVYCWGYNTDFELGLGYSFADSYVPVPPVALPSNVVKVACGRLFTCALSSSGALYCWGYGQGGQIGDGSDARYRSTPVLVASSLITLLGVGSDHACATDSSNVTSCWGQNGYGQLGIGSQSLLISLSPAVVVGLTQTPRSIALGGVHSCILLADYNVTCFGRNSAGQLGDNTGVQRSFPQSYVQFPWMSASQSPSISLSSSATPTSTASASFSISPSPSPVWSRSGGVTVVNITSGYTHVCCVASTGNTLCFGQNTWGELGNPTFVGDGSSSPVVVAGLPSPFVAVRGGGYHTCGMLANGQLLCFGRNDVGQVIHWCLGKTCSALFIHASCHACLAARRQHNKLPSCSCPSGRTSPRVQLQCWRDAHLRHHRQWWAVEMLGFKRQRPAWGWHASTPQHASGCPRAWVWCAASCCWGLAHVCAIISCVHVLLGTQHERSSRDRRHLRNRARSEACGGCERRDQHGTWRTAHVRSLCNRAGVLFRSEC